MEKPCILFVTLGGSHLVVGCDKVPNRSTIVHVGMWGKKENIRVFKMSWNYTVDDFKRDCGTYPLSAEVDLSGFDRVFVFVEKSVNAIDLDDVPFLPK